MMVIMSMHFTGKDVEKNHQFCSLVYHQMKSTYLFILLFQLCTCLPGHSQSEMMDEERVNLALRRTADLLLRASGDSTSRIPPIEHPAAMTWRIILHQSFEYDALPEILQSSLARYDISLTYQVTVKNCQDQSIALGFSKKDIIQDTTVACQGRAEPEGCHFIEIIFQEPAQTKAWWTGTGLLVLLTLVTSSGALMWYRKKSTSPSAMPPQDEDWIGFGKSRLNSTALLLECNGVSEKLTYREAKLLRLFATQTNQLLERDYILREVWGEEGIQVSRSVDMFISRLRKKLANDAGISIVAIHGVGYRMEITA